MLVYAVDGDSSTIQSRHQLYASHPNQHVNDMRSAQMAPSGFLTALRGMVSPTDLAVNSRRKLLFPVGLLVLITVATIGATLFVGAKKQDEIAISSSINLAGSILRKMEVDLGLLVLDYTFWDEAIENLIIKPDMSWAPRNIGWYLEENFDMSATVVLSGRNELIYAAVDGTDRPSVRTANFGRDLETLLSQARLSSGNGKPTPKTGFLLFDGMIHLAAASVLSNHELEQTIDNRAVLIMLRRIDEEFLAGLASDYELLGMRLHGPQNEESSLIRINGIGGTKLATLVWNPMLPGRDFLRSTVPLTVILLLVIGALSFLFVRRTFRMAAALHERGEGLERLNDELRQENSARKETQVALEESRSVLEERVRERTMELTSSEARLAEAQRLAKIGVWEHDLGSTDIRCLNHTSLLFGSEDVTDTIPLEDLMSRIDENDVETIKSVGISALETSGSDIDVTYRLRYHNGEAHVIHSLSKIIRDESGHPFRLEGFVQDIPEQRTLEENLLQAQKMEALGKLTGGIVHDFNNILNVVIGHLDLLADEADVPTAKRLEAAIKAALRGSELANGLLAFSRRKPLQSEVVDLNTVLTRTRDFLRRALRENIEFELHSSDRPCLTRVDSSGLETALLNLAVNARDAMPDGGRLTIETRTVKLDGSTSVFGADPPHGEFAKLEIEDTGTGISESDLNHIFNPFYTTKEVGKGTGLGLSQVYGFVSQSRGFLNVQSQSTRGTKFEIYLPVVREEALPENSTGILPEVRANGERVLVVEDDADVRELTIESLTGLGYAVVAAANGAEGLEILEKDRDFDLVFTDVVMPGEISGPDLAAVATSKYPGLKVPCLSG